MLLFRQMKSLLKFAAVHANAYNQFHLDRHLIDHQACKAACSTELAEWRNFMA
jgi:hypothetical protein